MLNLWFVPRDVNSNVHEDVVPAVDTRNKIILTLKPSKFKYEFIDHFDEDTKVQTHVFLSPLGAGILPNNGVTVSE